MKAHAANDEPGLVPASIETVRVTRERFNQIPDIAPVRAYAGANWKENREGVWVWITVTSVTRATDGGDAFDVIDGMMRLLEVAE